MNMAEVIKALRAAALSNQEVILYLADDSSARGRVAEVTPALMVKLLHLNKEGLAVGADYYQVGDVVLVTTGA
ncbi:hypothetical protein ACFO9Q_03120 [Paenibacillus sp. GCM10023252]|uniref:hypothetical protein n=1 Tax=Paenibacillus sp. GCM10023252 TaxID=3252649 RepID=UPI00360F2924